jgi:sugar (pentulose or hexulose) kinase
VIACDAIVIGDLVASPLPGSATPANAWVGVDLGTHAVRVAIVSDDSTVLALTSRTFSRIRRDDRIHEQDPDEWWTATVSALGSALAEVGAVTLRGLSASGTSGTVLLVRSTATDAAQPLTAGIMYNDMRAAQEADALRAEIPAESWSRTGFVPTATSGLAKAVRLFKNFREENGSNDDAGVRLAHQVDVITSRLCGTAVASDTSHAMKSGVDLFTQDWPYDDFDRLGIPTGFLPEVASPGTVVGVVSAAIAELTGLPAGLPVVAGMSDGCAGQIASGVLAAGAWAAVLGTTTVLKGVSDTLLKDPLQSLYHHRPPGSSWWPGGASATGSGILSAEFSESELAALRSSADLIKPASVVSYPLLGRGERFPFLESTATAFSTGTAIDRTDHYVSLMQGMALVIRLCLERVELLGAEVRDSLALVGGVTRSEQFVQLAANVLGRPVRVPRAPEGAVGMAVLAASTESSLLDAAQRMLGAGTTVDPQSDRIGDFDEHYDLMLRSLSSRGWMDHHSPHRTVEAQ